MRPPSIASRFVAVLAALAAASPALHAQAPASAAPGFTLADLVRATIATNARIVVEREKARTYEGRVIAAGAPFDAQVRTTMRSERENEPYAAVGTGARWVQQSSSAYDLTMQKQLPLGVVVAPTASVSRSTLSTVPGAPTGTASAQLAVLVPLMYNRGGAIPVKARRVLEMDLAGVLHDWRHATATSVVDATLAYWAYLAASRRLAVLEIAEARARRLLDQTTILVEKQERAAADLVQLGGNLATKRASRVAGEQALADARQQLGLTIGVDAASILAIAAPATDFPRPEEVGEPPADPRAIAALVQASLDRRNDRRGAIEKNEASVLELSQFRDAVRPRLDLVVSAGYQGLQTGRGLLEPLWRDPSGLNASVRVEYELAPSRSAERGRVVQSEAFLVQQRAGLREMERAIGAAVPLAVEELRRTRLALAHSDSAVALYRTTIENELRKFQLGTATLFDVLNAEDALTTALLNAIGAQRAYAAAIARYRLATGTVLVDAASEQPAVDPAALTTIR